MGQNNSQPQNNPNPPPPNNQQAAPPQNFHPNQYAHLTTNSQNQQILNQIYSNNTLDAATYPQFGYGYPGNPYRNQSYAPPAPVTVKKTMAIKNDLIINKASIKFTPSETVPSLYHLTFQFDCLCNASVSVFYAVKEQIDPTTNITLSINPLTSFCPPNTFFYNSGQDLEFTKDQYPLDLKQVGEKVLLASDYVEQFPVIIKMDKTDKSQENKLIYIYCTVQKNETTQLLSLRVLRQKIQLNGRAFILNEVYGIVGAGLDKTGDEEGGREKDCSICLSQRVNTIILPCKHMCVCFDCAADLRKKSQKCPICRTVIEGYLKLQSGFQNKNEKPQEPMQN